MTLPDGFSTVSPNATVDPPVYAEPCAGTCGRRTLEPDEWESFSYMGDLHHVCPQCRSDLVMWAASKVSYRLDNQDKPVTPSQRRDIAEAQAILAAVDQWV